MADFIKRDKMESVLKTLASLTRQQVLVGIPDSAEERSDGPISNAVIGHINEFGSPANNIPARPHLVLGVESTAERTSAEFKQAASAALSGKPAEVDTHLNRAGLVAQAAVRQKITSGPFVPLADATIRARARRGRQGAVKELASRKAGNDPNPENARPLIDTGQYRRAITYVVRKK